MYLLLIGMALFFGIHSIGIVASEWRDRMALNLGALVWRGGYSLLSLAGFLLMLQGYALSRAAPEVWYVPPVALHHVTRLLMLPVFPLLLAAYLPGRLQTAAKHPMLAAVKFWALAHLLANGNAGDVLLFGGFLAWAVVDRISLKRRPQRRIAGASPGKWNDLVAIVGGLALYLLFVAGLHQRLFGVSPLA